MWFALTAFLFLHLTSSLAQYNSENYSDKSHLLTHQRKSNLFYGVAPNSFNIYWPENPNIKPLYISNFTPLFISFEYFLKNRFSVNTYTGIQTTLSKFYFDTTAGFNVVNTYNSNTLFWGIGFNYYPKLLNRLNTERLPFRYDIGINSSFNRSYTRGQFKNSTNKSAYNDASLNMGFDIKFHLKNFYNLPTSRYSFRLISNFPILKIEALYSQKTNNIIAIHNRTSENMNFGIGLNYALQSNEYTVKERNPKYLTNLLDDYYKKGSWTISGSANTRHSFSTDKDYSNNIIYNLESEYFLKNRISANIGYLGAKSFNIIGDPALSKENKFNAFATFYPKLVKGVNRISFSGSFGVSFLNAKVWQNGDLINPENNYGFSTVQLIGAYSFNYKPIKIFKIENNRLGFQVRTMGSIYTINSLTKFASNTAPFEVFGSGISRGLLVRVVYKLN